MMDRLAGTENYRAILARRRKGLADQLSRIFNDANTFVLEIGCGHGHFLTAYAQAHPSKLCVGIDIATERIDRALRKRSRARLHNLHFIQAEARLFLETLPAGLRLDRIFVLFPDPWPKLRHQKHRLLQPDFLAALACRALPDTRLHFRTDFEPYFDDVSTALGSATPWEPVDERWPFDFETVFQSRAPIFYSLTARPVPKAMYPISPPGQG